ncbi:FAD/NAD(P)-binding oxidoreductase [Conexibacter sp. DBS9H8]|uniref:NAD(P)/FAD-dependent oxidoreductase n=1 Tax=Conexibacter sp. DBS9H8 TaxID=2937801 RepID=UPI00200BF0CA|nr:FAD/NAD(P)-binding oxidoreductase [Conexibacter sp. DBS9H8]
MSIKDAQSPLSAAPAARTRHHQVVIVGGGSAGATVAARLCRALKEPDVAVIEPSDVHYYQPLWTLVGGGVTNKETTRRREADVLPSKATLVRNAAKEFIPSENTVVLDDGSKVTYDYLVVAMGIKLNWTAIKGMSPDLIGQHGICSNYLYEGCEQTWKTLQAFKGGNAVFTMPVPPIKCAGAPQKIMYLADDHFRRSGVREKATVSFFCGAPSIFSVKEYAETLAGIVQRKGIQTHFKYQLAEIQPDSQTAIFHSTGEEDPIEIHFDMIHITPPQCAPDVLKGSPISDAGGWVSADKFTLQHPEFPNIFSLGDCSSLPTSKTGAAIRKQAPVVAENLMKTMRGEPTASFKRYDGYTSCPLVTGYGKLILAEFDYDLKPKETFPFNQNKERWSMYQLKRHGLPALYWNGMLKGRA